jgi:hypothetical protein
MIFPLKHILAAAVALALSMGLALPAPAQAAETKEFKIAWITPAGCLGLTHNRPAS